MIRSVLLVSSACLLAVTGIAVAQSAQPVPESLKGPSLEGFEKFTIPQIQGAYTFSALTGETVQTTGVVTAIAADTWGFWIQDPKGDGDPATSDGLYIAWGGKQPAPEHPKVGDLVQLIGRIQEPHLGLELPRTQMSVLIPIKVLSSGNPLPEPLVLRNQPDVELADGVSFWEPIEGMRVTLQNARVIGPTNRFGEFTVLLAADAVPGSGYYPAKGTLLIRNLGGDKVDYNPERVLIDDRILGKLDEVRPGDEVGTLAGVVDFNFGYYKIEAERIEMKSVQPPPKSPFSTLGGQQGNVRVADLNMSSFFDEVDDPDRYDENSDPGAPLAIPTHEEVEMRISKFNRALIDELRLPDIVVMQEFETTELVQRVADRVNAEAGTRYKAISLQTSDRRGLEVGFLFDQKRVELVEYHQLKGPDVEAAFGFSSAYRTREPLVGIFRLSPGGPPLTIFALKLKSKRMEPQFPNLNPAQDRFTERQRKLQTTVIRRFINELLAKDPNALVMAAGDCGDFPFPEPGEGVDAISILEGQGNEMPLENLVGLAEEGTAYTMIFHGNGITLSHMLVSPALRKRFVHVDMLHFNATMPNRYGTVPDTALRATDRDVIEASFDLRPKTGNAESAPEAARVRLTDTPHVLEVFPAISPNGEFLAYSSDRKGGHEIYVRRMDGKGEERQVTSDGRHNVQADWSPDGRFLVYHSVRGGGIWVIPVEGGKTRQLADFGSDPAWSPDGKTVAFQSEPLEALSLYTFNGMPPATLWLIPAEGGTPRQLTHPGHPHGGHGAPAWSADGQRITFSASDIEPFAELWSISVNGTDLQLVKGTMLARDPLFARNGILFYSSPDPARGFRWGVWQIPMSGGKPSVVSTLPARNITMTRDGCRAVVNEMGMAGNLWTIPVSPETGEATGTAAPFTDDPDDRSSQPVFSPDASRIALHRVVDGNRFQIWLTDPKGGTRTFLTNEATYGAGPPVWLPDGKHLVFNSRPGDGTMLLKKIDVDTKVVEPYRQLDPKWSWIRLSPEGQRIAFARTNEQSVANIWMLPSLDAKEPKQITFDKETADFPMWSPDGKWLAMRLRRGSDTQIGIVSADGGEVKQLTSGPGENWLPSWSPDNSKIAFAGLRDGIWNIYWVARTGGPIHKVTSQPDRMTIWVRYPAWYPTGDRIIFEYSETLGDLWQLDTCPGETPEKKAE